MGPTVVWALLEGPYGREQEAKESPAGCERALRGAGVAPAVTTSRTGAPFTGSSRESPRT